MTELNKSQSIFTLQCDKKDLSKNVELKSLASQMGKSNNDWHLSLKVCVAKIQQSLSNKL